ncbi:MAG TPA: bifunctional phosphoglucose/phosphomannose isomerase [Spirochaetota bacterium]|nr:bifunctional phosphoglucose/phosphomannose isomerase [Spirochaetota bacterium]
MNVDTSNMRRVLVDFPGQCAEALSIGEKHSVSGNYSKILVLGMGGSAIGGAIIRALLHKGPVPVFTSRDYDIPGFIGADTLALAVSYSGNTEETLSALEKARAAGAATVAVTSGGEIASKADKTLLVPGGLQPRCAVGYLLLPALRLLANSGLAPFGVGDYSDMMDTLADTASYEREGRALASRLYGRVPVIHTSERTAPAGYRLKCQINENAKHPAYHHVYPELCHNELVGFAGMERDRFIVVTMRDSRDHERVARRMDVCAGLFGETVDVVEIASRGEGPLARMMSLIYLGDWASYELALLKKIDPTPVTLIEALKKTLKG